jgi:hypothetical protein
MYVYCLHCLVVRLLVPRTGALAFWLRHYHRLDFLRDVRARLCFGSEISGSGACDGFARLMLTFVFVYQTRVSVEVFCIPMASLCAVW